MLITRRAIGVSKVIVHDEFSHTIHDIALLQLGKKYPLTTLINTDSKRNGWISQSTALPVFPTMETALLVGKVSSLVSSLWPQ